MPIKETEVKEDKINMQIPPSNLPLSKLNWCKAHNDKTSYKITMKLYIAVYYNVLRQLSI